VSARAERPIILGVTGSVAAFRAVELASALTQEGWRVLTVMTDWACRFVGPLSFSAVTAQPVLTDLEPPDPATGRDHVAIAREAAVLAIVPATANSIAKLTHGIADNVLTLTALAFTGPVLIAPAMNCRMYASTPVQENIRTLTERGHRFVGPVEGRLACGETGPGRLAPVSEIMTAVRDLARGTEV
jgi:phosphopantothenoylcysteine decarboxylase/phosphopantothenate--cysteine ligase